MSGNDRVPGESPRLVDLDWPPDKIKEFCENNDNWILQLSPQMTPDGVSALYRRQLTVPAPYEGLIAEIAGDERTPQWVIENVCTRFASSVEVMASLATNPAVSEETLHRLLSHEHPSVREHAEQTLRRRQLLP